MPVYNWQSTTKERLRRVLNYPASLEYLTLLSSAMDRVRNTSPETILTVESILDEYDMAKQSYVDGSGEAGLIKAGPLEWALGSKSGGYQTRLSDLKKEISDTFLLKPFSTSSSGYVFRR